MGYAFARLLGPCFKTGRTGGRLARRRRSAPCPGATRRAKAARGLAGHCVGAVLPPSVRGSEARARSPQGGRGRRGGMGRGGPPSRACRRSRRTARESVPGGPPGRRGARPVRVWGPAPGLAPWVESPGRLFGSVRFPLNGFTYSSTLSSKFFSTFPHGTCSLSASCRCLALGGVYCPLWAAFSNSRLRGHAGPRHRRPPGA